MAYHLSVSSIRKSMVGKIQRTNSMSLSSGLDTPGLLPHAILLLKVPLPIRVPFASDICRRLQDAPG